MLVVWAITGAVHDQQAIQLSDKAKEAVLANGARLIKMAEQDRRIGVIGRTIENWKALIESPCDIALPCGSHKRIFIDPYGNLRGCIHSGVLASLFETTIEDYLNSKAYNKFLEFSKRCNICIHGCNS